MSGVDVAVQPVPFVARLRAAAWLMLPVAALVMLPLFASSFVEVWEAAGGVSVSLLVASALLIDRLPQIISSLRKRNDMRRGNKDPSTAE